MKLTFKHGDYDKYIGMVNASKELLNDSIILRSIKENIDARLSTINQANQKKTDVARTLVLALPLLGVLLWVNIIYGLSWRLIPVIGLIIFFIFYKVQFDGSSTDNQLLKKDIHNNDPMPLKYLRMKVDYLSSHSNNTKNRLVLLRAFYIIFFPILCYFIYEVLFKSAPFGKVLFGLPGAYLIGGVFWFFFFSNDFSQNQFLQKQLQDYKHIIDQHNKSMMEEE